MESPFAWWQWTFIVLGFSITAILAGLALSYFILRAQKKPWPFNWPASNKTDGYPVIQTQLLTPAQLAVGPQGATNRSPEKKDDSGGVNRKDPAKKPEETITQYIQSRVPPPRKVEPQRAAPPLKEEPRHFVPPGKAEPARVPPARKAEPRRFPVVPKADPIRAPAPKLEPIRASVPKVEPVRAQAPKIEPVRAAKSELMKEVEANLTIAATAVRGKLVSFNSDCMNSSRSRLTSLSNQIQEDLSEAYTDIRLANTLVWLSKDMGRQSSEMESGYLELCGKIAERLGQAVPGLINSGL